MNTTQKERAERASSPTPSFRRPDLRDGAVLWRMARDSGSLDLNSPYAYLLWCDQFAETSIVAEVDGSPAGFLIGFRPPGREHVLFVWQVAVAPERRGLGLAGRMLDTLVERLGARAVEASVTPSNTASRKLFQAFARRAGCTCSEAPYLDPDHFPDHGHESEVLFRIGPIRHDQGEAR